MTWNNSLNPEKGKVFQIAAGKIMGIHFGVEFAQDIAIEIGHPQKAHRFDLVSHDHQFVGECKNYSWTETGNVPSAKLGFINEAVFCLTFIPSSATRFVAMRRATTPNRGETLAEFYFRTYRHLLGDIVVFEVDLDSGAVREIR